MGGDGGWLADWTRLDGIGRKEGMDMYVCMCVYVYT